MQLEDRGTHCLSETKAGGCACGPSVYDFQRPNQEDVPMDPSTSHSVFEAETEDLMGWSFNINMLKESIRASLKPQVICLSFSWEGQLVFIIFLYFNRVLMNNVQPLTETFVMFWKKYCRFLSSYFVYVYAVELSPKPLKLATRIVLTSQLAQLSKKKKTFCIWLSFQTDVRKAS